jgi:hypothetical protein
MPLLLVECLSTLNYVFNFVVICLLCHFNVKSDHRKAAIGISTSIFVPTNELAATEHFELLSGLDPFTMKEEAIRAMRESLGGNLEQVTSKPKSRIGDTSHTWMYQCNFRDKNGDH